MSNDAPVDPAEVPEFTGDEAVLAEKVKALSGAGVKISTAAGDVHTSFGGLRAFYRAPEAEQLFATTRPVQDRALEVGSDLCVIAGALGTYAHDIGPLVKRLDELRRAAADFRAKVADDDKWREDGDLTDENLARRNEIAEVWARFQEAERTCHDKIVALVGGSPLTVDDGSHKPGMYGYDAEMLKQAESLPWGDAVAESTPAWQIWEHGADFATGFFVDGVVGTVKSLGILVGTDGWDAAGEAWKGLGLLSTGVLISTTPAAALFWAPDDKDMPPLLRDSRTAMKETGKALIAYDKWDENPARAGGLTTFNVLSILATRGAGSAASGAGRSGAAAKALSFAGKAGQAVDPTTYLLTGATASMRKIGDVMTGLRGMGHVDVSLPVGTIELPPGASVLPDGTLHLPNGAAVPPGVVELPPGTVRLPDGTPAPPGSIDFGDGVVHLPADASPPSGAIPVPEGTLKVTDGTIALPQGTVRLTDPTGATVYADPKGNLYNADGTLLQRAEDAKKETPPPAATGADNPRVGTPAKQPALVGADATASDDVLRVGDSLNGSPGDLGRLNGNPSWSGSATVDSASGGTGRGDHSLNNSLDRPSAGGDHTSGAGGHGDTAPGGVHQADSSASYEGSSRADGEARPPHGSHGDTSGGSGGSAHDGIPPSNKSRKPEESWPAGEEIRGSARGKNLLYPHARHNLSGVKHGEPDTDNTIILPEVKDAVRADIAEIAAGRAEFDAHTQRYTVNGRSYAIEPNGRTFPVSGPGFINLNRVEYAALKAIMKAGGDMTKVQVMFTRAPKFAENPHYVRRAIDLYREYYS
ncbi:MULTISPECIES: hypothetical protein [Streptomyces]|uniref:hypothetical protein n=1 Tax=Streptomyces TaxID=1883 RepID=UPI0007CD8830|nr:hypothetical protein A4V12_33735 [Streptomyces noursei]